MLTTRAHKPYIHKGFDWSCSIRQHRKPSSTSQTVCRWWFNIIMQGSDKGTYCHSDIKKYLF